MCRSFGEFIRNQMKEKNLTQQQLADAIGVSRSAVSLYVTDRNMPDDENIKKIALVLNMTSMELHKVISTIRASAAHEERIKTNEIIKAHYGTTALKVLQALNSLTSEGKAKVLSNALDLLEIPKYNDSYQQSLVDDQRQQQAEAFEQQE